MVLICCTKHMVTTFINKGSEQNTSETSLILPTKNLPFWPVLATTILEVGLPSP